MYGTLGAEGFFKETTPYAPNSPYSASKAGSDFLVRAYHHTFGMNVTTSNCSNNYGPKQHSEKLIPTIIRDRGIKPFRLNDIGTEIFKLVAQIFFQRQLTVLVVIHLMKIGYKNGFGRLQLFGRGQRLRLPRRRGSQRNGK